MEKGWRGLPFNPISEFYIRRFGEKVYKIPVTVVDNCPNRMGLRGMKTCNFCDVWGSAAQSESATMTLKDQIEKYQGTIGSRFHAKKFLVYFQAYTNTFTKLSSIRDNFELALTYPFVHGFTVGTRPDCISKGVLDFWTEMHERSFVAVEIGVQSFFNDDLLWMRRGHTREQSLDAIHKIAADTSVNLGIHLMFGLPNETDERIIETARICNTLPISNVKLHNLHILENTPLADDFRSGLFTPIERDLYAHRVKLFLQHLAPHIHVHRLAALASRWDELVAPTWTKDKMGTHQFIVDTLRATASYQSEFYLPKSADEAALKEVLRLRAEKIIDPPSRKSSELSPLLGPVLL